MKRTALVLVILVSTVFALWSALNPGWYYLERSAVLVLMGAVAVWALIGRRHRGYAIAASLIYVGAVLLVLIVWEELRAPTGQVESINLFLIPFAALFLIAGTAAAVSAKLRT